MEKQPAVEFDHDDARRLFRKFDDNYDVRERLGIMAKAAGEWAGIPMPLEGQGLSIEKSYPFAKLFDDRDEADRQIEQGGTFPDGAKLRSHFYSKRWRCEVIVFQERDGRVTKGAIFSNRIDRELHTMACSDAWGIEQEGNAVQLLGRLVTHSQFKRYMLSGLFMETSKRSGVTYFFRKLRPTIAVKMHHDTNKVKGLAALCMHPIGYYTESWAGAMCPTDDVIAHLQLMRADEPMFWRRCNQHPLNRSEAGL